MPRVIYKDVLMSPTADFVANYHTIKDPSQTDHVYTVLDVEGLFEVCGQAEVVESLDDPPVSYATDGSTKLVNEADGGIRGLGAALGGGTGVGRTTEGPERQKGAVNDDTGLRVGPYDGDVTSPSFAEENRSVPKLVVRAIQPVHTWALIWPRLTAPRGRLIVLEDTDDGSNGTVVISPDFGLHCDARNGPDPTLLTMVHSQGDEPTYYVKWSCRTYLSKRVFDGDTGTLYTVTKDGKVVKGGDPLLSNRWTMTHTHDKGWTQIHVDGTAVFDVALLHEQGTNPDTYRPNLMLPIPQGFERGQVEVTCSADMTTLHYSFVDTQKEVMFPAGTYVNAVDIQTEHRQTAAFDNDWLQSSLDATDSLLNRLWLLKASKADEQVDKPKPKPKKKKKPPRRGLGES